MVYLDLKGLNINIEHIKLSRLIKRRLRMDWDLVMAVSGEEGCGKSTYGMIQGALVDKRFRIDKNVSLLPNEKEILDEFRGLKKYQCYLIDEAIRSLYKMNFMTRLQQGLVQMWATERWHNKFTIMILPRFTDLTENFRNHRVKLWVYILARGIAVVHCRNDDAHSSDPWMFDYCMKYKQKAFKGKNVATIPIEERLKIERKLPTYLIDFTFPDLPEEFKAIYQDLKQKARLKFLDQQKEEEKTSEGKVATRMRIERNWLIGYLIDEVAESGKKNLIKEKIMKELNIPKASISNILKEYRLQIKEKEKKDDIEAFYTGVDKFLDQAIQLEKNKVRSKVFQI